MDIQAAFLASMGAGGASPNVAAVVGGGGDSAESVNLEQAALALMVSGDVSSVQDLEPLSVGELEAAAA